VRALRPTTTVGFLAPGARSLGLAEAEASDEAARREPLCSLRLE
jgi:hypothetical protein